IRGVDLNVRTTGVFVLGNHFLPVLTTVGGAIDSPLLAGPVGVAEHCGKNTIGIAGIDRKRGNLLSVDQTEMGPGLAGVGGSVNTIAYRKIRPMQPLAATYINDVRVGRSNCDCADGLRGLGIEKGIQ